MTGYRKHLSADALLASVRRVWSKGKFKACKNTPYSWEDCLMSGLAVFGFKFPSLLQFQEKIPLIRRNLSTLYGVDKVPSDTCLRERLDQLAPEQLRSAFKIVFAQLQRAKVLESFRYLGGHYLCSIDGTGQYSSEKVRCEQCCEKHHRSGKTSYYHDMLAAVLVHPDHKVVIPLAPEPIVKSDGATKNDCERNASKRLLMDLRREHPHLKLLIVEDSLGSNFPHLSLLDDLKMSYIIGVKQGDHATLFDWIKALTPVAHTQTDLDGTQHLFHCYHDVPLNDTHHTYRVNVMEYWETKKSGKIQHFSWVTKLPISEENAYQIMRAGRSRWRIENETFNTLKNQGYHFEHNYGHGYKNLCSVMSMLMMLAFLIDQVQQLCCGLYQQARKNRGPFRVLYENIRALIQFHEWSNWSELLNYLGMLGCGPPEVRINFSVPK